MKEEYNKYNYVNVNQGQAQSHENVGFSFDGMNSMTIDHVLQTPTDRVEDLMNVDSGSYYYKRS